MKIIGPHSHTVVTKAGIRTIRVEAFHDDRFRLMFVVNDGTRDTKWIQKKFRKGTKQISLDYIWPEIECG
jgi:hypothetical protein